MPDRFEMLKAMPPEKAATEITTPEMLIAWMEVATAERQVRWRKAAPAEMVEMWIRSKTAIHEAGHAVAAAHVGLKFAKPICVSADCGYGFVRYRQLLGRAGEGQAQGLVLHRSAHEGLERYGCLLCRPHRPRGL